jgi:hypothetical protein
LQRCLVHVQRDAHRDLTMRPKTQAGKVFIIVLFSAWSPPDLCSVIA